MGHGHQVAGKHLWRICPAFGGASRGSPQGCRPSRLRRLEPADVSFQESAQPFPTLGDALNGGCPYLEVKYFGCETHQTVALNIVRRPKTTPIHELERYMRCKDCSRQSGRPFKRSHLVALRSTKISAFNPPSTWWPGER
jgi:hypothetical protein